MNMPRRHRPSPPRAPSPSPPDRAGADGVEFVEQHHARRRLGRRRENTAKRRLALAHVRADELGTRTTISVAPAADAAARRRVLPVPGGPQSNTPRGTGPPHDSNSSGRRRGSSTSSRSASGVFADAAQRRNRRRRVDPRASRATRRRRGDVVRIGTRIVVFGIEPASSEPEPAPAPSRASSRGLSVTDVFSRSTVPGRRPTSSTRKYALVPNRGRRARLPGRGIARQARDARAPRGRRVAADRRRGETTRRSQSPRDASPSTAHSRSVADAHVAPGAGARASRRHFRSRPRKSRKSREWRRDPRGDRRVSPRRRPEGHADLTRASCRRGGGFRVGVDACEDGEASEGVGGRRRRRRRRWRPWCRRDRRARRGARRRRGVSREERRDERGGGVERRGSVGARAAWGCAGRRPRRCWSAIGACAGCWRRWWRRGCRLRRRRRRERAWRFRHRPRRAPAGLSTTARATQSPAPRPAFVMSFGERSAWTCEPMPSPRAWARASHRTARRRARASTGRSIRGRAARRDPHPSRTPSPPRAESTPTTPRGTAYPSGRARAAALLARHGRRGREEGAALCAKGVGAE